MRTLHTHQEEKHGLIKFHMPALSQATAEPERCIVGQGRFNVATQTSHARLGTPLRLAVKLFEAKSAA